MILTIDDVPMKTVQIISIISGKYFLIGGDTYHFCPYRRCIPLLPLQEMHTTSAPTGDIYHFCPYRRSVTGRASYKIIDRCNPNPCEHCGRLPLSAKPNILRCVQTAEQGCEES